MRPIQVKQLDYDLTPTAGLALVGHHLKTLAPVLAEVDAALPVRTGVASSDIVRSYLGLLTSSSSRRWALACCPRARRCASAWMPARWRWARWCPR